MADVVGVDQLEDTLAGAVAVVLVNWKKLDGQTRAQVLALVLAILELAAPRTARVLPFRRRRQ